MDDSFVASVTEFESVEEFLSAGGLAPDTPADDPGRLRGEFDEVITARTQFESWPSMRAAAESRTEKGGV
ncbi:MAG: hypothetical protein ABEJ57_02865 [Halobacteriaceae archaeon]